VTDSPRLAPTPVPTTTSTASPKHGPPASKPPVAPAFVRTASGRSLDNDNDNDDDDSSASSASSASASARPVVRTQPPPTPPPKALSPSHKQQNFDRPSAPVSPRPFDRPSAPISPRPLAANARSFERTSDVSTSPRSQPTVARVSTFREEKVEVRDFNSARKATVDMGEEDYGQ